jgi:hypothetical protein
MLNFNDNNVTFNHFNTNSIAFYTFYAKSWLLAAFFPSFWVFLDLLDPDPGGHRIRIQCGFRFGSGFETLDISSFLRREKNLSKGNHFVIVQPKKTHYWTVTRVRPMYQYRHLIRSTRNQKNTSVTYGIFLAVLTFALQKRYRYSKLCINKVILWNLVEQ